MADQRVLVLGDSAFLSIHERLEEILAEDGLDVASPAGSCGCVRTCLEHADQWLTVYTPDIVLVSCAWTPREQWARTAANEVERPRVAAFETELTELMLKLARFCGRQLVFATFPGVHPERFAARMGGGPAGEDLAHRLNRLVDQHNESAMNVAERMNFAVARVEREVGKRADECFEEDGIGLTGFGRDVAAREAATGVYSVLHA